MSCQSHLNPPSLIAIAIRTHHKPLPPSLNIVQKLIATLLGHAQQPSCLFSLSNILMLFRCESYFKTFKTERKKVLQSYEKLIYTLHEKSVQYSKDL